MCLDSNVNVRLPSSERARVDRIARRLRLRTSDVARHALRIGCAELDRHGAAALELYADTQGSQAHERA